MARIEHWTKDRRRRSDVSVQLTGGKRLALEVQIGDLSDVAWLQRHEDYQAADVTDIWFWHPGHAPHRVQLENKSVPWSYSLETDRVGVPLANGHPLDGQWWLEPPAHLVPHFPPCPQDDIRLYPIGLERFGLSEDGLVIPSSLATELAELTRKARHDMGRIRAAQAEHERLQHRLRAANQTIDSYSMRLCRRGLTADLAA